MNKNDLKLIVIVLIIGLSLIIYSKLTSNTSKQALVYYENNLIKTINLTIDETYLVDGFNGIVEIEVKDNKIRVITETSPYNLCSKQGFISETHEVIICLPNKIFIELDSNEYDAVVR